MFRPFSASTPLHTYAWLMEAAVNAPDNDDIGTAIINDRDVFVRVYLARLDVTPGSTPWIKPLGGKQLGEGAEVIAYLPFDGVECFRGPKLKESAFARPISSQCVDGEHWAVYTDGRGLMLCDMGIATFDSQTLTYEFAPYALSGYAPEPTEFLYIVPHTQDLVRQREAEAAAAAYVVEHYGQELLPFF